MSTKAAFPLKRMDSRFRGNDKNRFPQQELVRDEGLRIRGWGSG